MIKLVLYYQFFYVDILYFVTPTDLLNASLEGIAVFFLVCLPVLLFALTAIRRVTMNKEQRIFSLQFIKQQYLFSIFVVVISGVLIWNLSKILCYSADNVLDTFGYVAILFFLLIYSPFLAPLAIDNGLFLFQKKPLSPIAKIFVFLFMFGCVFYIFDAFSDATLVQDHYTIDTWIYLKDGTVLYGDSSNYYIGNTSDYLFYYSEDSVATVMYPMSEVKKIEF